MKRGLLVLIWVLITITTLPLHGQIVQNQNPIREILDDSIKWTQPFNVSEVPSRALQTETFLKTSEEELSTREPEDIFGGEWDSVYVRLKQVYQEFQIDSTTIIGPSALKNRENEWLIYQRKLAGWNDDLTKDLSWSESKKVQVDRLTNLWEITRQNATKEAAVEGLVKRINEVRTKVGVFQGKLDSNFDSLLDKQVQISELIELTENKLNSIYKAEEAAQESLLRPERPTLFAELGTLKSDTTKNFSESVNDVIDKRKSEFSTYFKNNRYIFFSSFIVLGILIFLLYILKFRSKSWFLNFEEGTDYENATVKIINLPIPVAIVLAILITAWMLPTIPVYIADLLWFIGLVPLLIMLLQVSPKNSHGYIIALSIVAIVNRADNFIYELPILSRLILLLNAILITIILFWLSYKKVHKEITTPGLFAIINIIRWLGLIGMPLAIITNLIGNVSGTEFLVNGYVDSLLSVLLTFVFFLVIRSLNDVILLSPVLNKLHVVKNHRDVIERHINKLASWALIIYLILEIANAFQFRDRITGFLSEIFFYEIVIGTLSITLIDITLFFVILWLSVRLSTIIGNILDEDVLPRAKTTQGVAATVVTMTKLIIVVVGFLVAVAASGFELSNLTLLVSAFGVGIGFGLQNIFNNFVSGIIIATERPVEVGDTIQVGNLTGSVKSVGIRSSVVRTWDGSEVIVPNGNLISNDLINWTHSDRQIRLSIPFGVAYGSDPRKTIEIATKAAEEHENSMKFPAPYTLFLGFGESSLDFVMRFWTDDYDNWIYIKSDVTLKIHDSLHENGIEIPFPQRDLHLRSVNDEFLGNITPAKSQENLKKLEDQYKQDKKKKKESEMPEQDLGSEESEGTDD